jgi:hypothetical protein
MQINAFPDPEDFVLRPCVLGGEKCVLIFPKKAGVVWNHQTKYFRSSIWTEDGKLVSASFRKFTNLGEQPEFEPLSLHSSLTYVRKIDGSALIISKVNGELVARTRGTHSASIMENGDEIPHLQKKYPKVFQSPLLENGHSLLCEWYSPRNIIIERESSEPELWLTGAVCHENYSYLPQSELNQLALEMEIPRPEHFDYPDLQTMREHVAQWSTGEGIVIYGNNGQTLKKVKALRYLRLHKLKSELSSRANLLDYYVSLGLPSYEDFFDTIKNTFDFELATQLQGEISKVCQAGKQATKLLDHMRQFTRELKHYPTRKEQAILIMQSYGGEKNSRAGMAFKLLDGKPLDSSDYLKLLWQMLKD